MAFGDARLRSEEEMSEINMIPLIDVMLVLLIVFIITVPVINHAVRLELPQAAARRSSDTPETIRIAVDAKGAWYWNDGPIDDEALPGKLAIVAALDPQPELHIRGDRDVRYERVAQVMALAQSAGLRRIAFVTDPRNASPRAP